MTALLLGVAGVVPLVAAPAEAAEFANTGRIEIGDPLMDVPYIPATPYPSNISVSGIGTSITDVNVKLCGLSATFPSDMNIMIVAPSGANALVLSDVGGNGNDEPDDPQSDEPVSNVNLTLDDAAANPLPADTKLLSGTYRPLDDDTGEIDLPNAGPDSDEFYDPAPPPSGKVALSTFNGLNPNGTWKLFMMDDFPGTAEDGETRTPVFTCGWSLQITTGSSTTPSLTVNNVSVTEGDSGTKTAIFKVRLSAASTSTVKFKAKTVDGTATAGSDYTALALTTFSISPGRTVKSVAVTVKGDTAVEPNETLLLRLSSPVNATIADDRGRATIVNDD